MFDKNVFRAYDIRGKAISDNPQITPKFVLSADFGARESI